MCIRDSYLSKIKLKLLPNKVHRQLQKLLKHKTHRLGITEESIRKYQEQIKIVKNGNWQELSTEINNAAKVKMCIRDSYMTIFFCAHLL